MAGMLLVASALFLAVAGTAAAGSADPSSVDYGDVPLNTTVTQTVTITVDAGYRMSAATGALNPPFAFDFDTCGAGGGFEGPGECTIKESFTPTDLGAASGTLNVFECPTAGGSCINIPVSLNGNGISVAAADPSSVDYGDVPLNTTVTQTVTITVDAGYRMSAATGALNPPFAFDFDTCGAGGGFEGPGECTIKESFTPTDLGAASGTLNVFECPTAGGSCINIPVSLSGNGVLPTADLALSLSGPSAPVPHSKSVTLTISVQNLGSFTAAGVQVTDTLPPGTQFVSASPSQGSCTTPPVGSTGTMVCSLGSLDPGSTATITVVLETTVKKTIISDTATTSSDTSTSDPVAANNTATIDVQIK